MGFNPEFFSLDDYRAKHVETIAKEKAGYKFWVLPTHGWWNIRGSSASQTEQRCREPLF